jgi:hypothetical protein
MPSQYELIELPGRFAVCRLSGDAPIPSWATAGAFFSITRTADELSILIDEAAVSVGWDQIAPTSAGPPLPKEEGKRRTDEQALSFILHPSAFVLPLNGGPAAAASLSPPTSEGIPCERGWRGLRVAGAVPFATVGLLESIDVP